LSPQNGGFIRAFWLVPDSCGKEFRAVAGSANRFFSTKFAKKNYIETSLKWKKVFKAGKESKNSFNSSGFFTKINSSE
jgi:hypothetical protein